MSRSRIVTVTEEDIAKGARGRPGSCPIALALRRTSIKARCIYVGGEQITLQLKDSSWAVHLLSGAMRRWIIKFDDGKPVEPFTFSIRV